MRLIAYATLLISSISIINAQEIKYNQFDKNQKKTGFWIGYLKTPIIKDTQVNFKMVNQKECSIIMLLKGIFLQ